MATASIGTSPSAGRVCPPSPRAVSNDEAIRQQVWNLLAAVNPRSAASDRRFDQRYPLARLLVVRAVDSSGVAASPRAQPEAVTAAGKDISERGLSFFHAAPLPFRRAVAEVEVSPGNRLRFLVDLSWCRFTRLGWYESGGRFLGAIAEENSPE